MIILSFLDSIFGRKEEEKEQILSLEDTEDFLSKDFEEKFQSLRKDASKLHQEFQSVASNMQENLKHLEESNFVGPVDYELLQNVVAHRRSFVKKMRIMLDHIDRPMELDFDSILDFSKSASSAVSEADEKTVMDYHFLKDLFEREADGTIKNFKILNKIADNFESLINGKKENLISVRNAQNDLQSIRNEIDNLNQKKDYNKDLDSKISELNRELERLRASLEEIRNSEAWHHFNELLEEKGSLEMELSDLKSQILQSVSPIERPLKKFENLVDRGIVKLQNEKVLKKYVDSPFDALLEEKSSDSINSILGMVLDNLSSGRIELKDREKVLAEIKWIIKNNVFGDFLERYLSLSDELRALEKSVSELEILTIKNDMEAMIGDAKRQIEITMQEMNNVANQMENMKKSIDERKIDLEKTMCLYTGRKVNLMINP